MTPLRALPQASSFNWPVYFSRSLESITSVGIRHPEYRDDRELISTIRFPRRQFPFLPKHTPKFKSVNLIPIPIEFPLHWLIPTSFPNAHSKTIKYKCKQSAVEQQKGGQQSLTNKNSKKHHTLFFKNQTTISTVILQDVR